jgi:hypothetical protein
MHPFDNSAIIMQRAANFHEIQEFLNSLNKEQLETLEMLMFSCASEPGGLVAAAHHGMVKQVLQYKFGVCTCGLEHETAEDLLKDDAESPHPNGPTEEYSEPPVITQMRKGAAELMEEYHLATVFGGALVCTNCGLEYPSLKDRMLKGPDDCHGCHLKAAQG